MDRRRKPKKKLKDFGREYFLNISVNALKHIIRAKNVGERRFWLVMFTIALFGTGFCVFEVWKVYESSFTKTIILSTAYSYSKAPFPSVTICEPSRVYGPVIETLYNNSLGRPDSYDEAVFKIIANLATIRLPLFEDFIEVKNYKKHYDKLNKLNISDMLRKAVRPCHNIFDSMCWWRNSYHNCCDIFELQKTCYGYCYSFNSDVSEYSKRKTQFYGIRGDTNDFWNDENEQGVFKRPRRTGGSGPWSGLRFSMRAQKIPPYINAKSGLVVMIRDPSALPIDRGMMVAKGTSGYIKVWGDKVIPTNRLIRVKPEKRHCLYPDEKTYLGRGYLRSNCLFNCYQRFMFHDCKCVPSFYYFHYEKDLPYPECNIEGLVCLAEHASSFINIVDRDKNLSSNLRCNCPGDCRSQKYETNIVVLNETSSADQITIDVFFHRSTCFLYETDLVFDFMNALVGYGGVCGLFLGASLISAVEFINFMTFRLYDYWVNRRYRNKIVQRFVY
ncbi:pickpocket protein 19-like [Melanaphis sacchari]|uniref:pickpocket protein 19-like n=1 Tax=Melanaphis sacchari TaxID=742174 RepID=UPI000DC14773|nr:pickpocket protein 19-like [Melanaphis sacchari]